MDMKEIFSRGASLLGEDGIARLRASRVAVFGVGGVGGYVVEALARSGVGSFDLIDNDVVAESNIRPSNLCYSNISSNPWQEE